MSEKWCRYLLTAPLFIAFALGHDSNSHAMQDSSFGSAKLAPVDADFYNVMMRIPEQWNRFVAGPVVARFLELPPVENAVEQFRSEWTEREGFGASVRTAMENPNTKDGLAFVLELISSELFVLGDKNVSQWYGAQAKLNDDMRIIAPKPGQQELQQSLQVLTKVSKSLDELTVPILLLGAKCKDVDLALGKIDQLEAVIQLGKSTIPNGALVFQNFDRIDDARGDRLQLRFDGTQIPWDEFPPNPVFDDENFKQLRKSIDKKSITITLGMFDGFFVLGISPSSKALLELGKTKSILDNPDFQLTKDAASIPLSAIGYSSNALSNANFQANLNNFFSRNLVTLVNPFLASVDENSEIRDFSRALLEDFKWVDETIAKLVPEFKGTTTYSFLTADGWERHDYSRTQGKLVDSSAPLILLEHLSTEPMMFTAMNLQSHPEYFQTCRQIVQKLKARIEEGSALDWSEVESVFSISEIFGPMLSSVFPNQDWDNILEPENVKASMDVGWPYLVRLADVWEKRFLPAMSGEHAIVLSGGNLAAKQWWKDMPPAVDPLALPELAALCGIKDRALMDSAFQELFTICDDMLEAIRAKGPNSIPADYSIPRPTRSQSKIGELYGYPIPADCPVPKEMMPQFLFSGDLMIESYSTKQSESLAEARKLSKGLGIIDPNAKLSSASYLDVGKIFEFVRPWIRYALTEGMESMDDSLLEGVLPENYELTGKDLLSAWSVLSKIGEFTSVTSGTSNGGSYVRSVYKSQKPD